MTVCRSHPLQQQHGTNMENNADLKINASEIILGIINAFRLDLTDDCPIENIGGVLTLIDDDVNEITINVDNDNIDIVNPELLTELPNAINGMFGRDFLVQWSTGRDDDTIYASCNGDGYGKLLSLILEG